MEAPSDFFVALATALLLASCSTTGPVISGRTQDISPTDIDAAMAALQGSIVDGPVRPAEIEVINHDEIRIHVERPAPSNYIAMVRVRGYWQVERVAPVHQRY
jgi:hypothetical protein